jgi:anti-sigma factor RsiW
VSDAGEPSCREIVEIVTDYLEDALPPDVRLRVERHLATCPGCLAYLDQMRETVRMLGRLPEESLDPAIRVRLLDAFRGWSGAAAG